MSYISDEVKRRNIPRVELDSDGKVITDINTWEKRRLEIVEMLSNEVYGHVPPAFPITVEEVKTNEKAAGKKVKHTTLIFHIDTPDGEVTFPAHLLVPRDAVKVPFFVNVAFFPNSPWSYSPIELLADAGIGIIMAYHKEITTDDGDFDTGIAKAFPRGKYDCGKISLWAWAASRMMDYLQTLDVVDKDKIAVIGHSRLGKTALWCSANDTRFTHVFSNNSGAAGDAIMRMKKGETVKDIYNRFPYWFVPKYAEYSDNEQALPFDQNFLIAASCPRTVGIGAAIEDEWADPESEFLACVTASPIYEALGMKGLVCEDRMPRIGDIWQEGNISYQLRDFGHFLGMHDWKKYIDILKK